jgi:hypothetical protein
MTIQAQNITLPDTNLLRRAIQADGVFEIAYGLGLAFAANSVAQALGLAGNGGLFVVTGIALIAVGIVMLLIARQSSVNLRYGLALAAINDISAIGLVAVLLLGLLPVSSGGAWLLGLTAAALFLFAIVEYIGWWQARRV